MKTNQKAIAPALNMAQVTDPLARQIAKARKGNPVDELGKLLEEESRWKRKQTIARNKLADIQDRIRDFAMRAAAELVKPKVS